jgi:hypothetical protein
MRPDNYNYQFEKETTGKYLRRVNFANICLSVSTFVLLMTGAFVFLKKSHTNDEHVIQLQQNKMVDTTTSFNLKGSTDIWITSVPSEFPSMIPYILENDEYDDDESFESFLRKSKYPTRHPRKKTTAPTAAATAILNTLVSSGMVTEELTSSPTPIIVIATDDFHTTPIVVVNTEEEEEEEEKSAKEISTNPYYAHMSGKIHE